MRFIHSITQNYHINSCYNDPVNLDYVVDIHIYDHPNGNWYAIKFRSDKHEVIWFYDNKLIRDNRLKEILEYINSKEF